MHYATSRKFAGSIPDEVIGFFNWPNPSSHTTAAGVDSASNGNEYRESAGGKGRPARKIDNLAAICEPIVYKMWEPGLLTPLWASTACYRHSLARKADFTAIFQPIV
jgi:hypothetical protein